MEFLFGQARGETLILDGLVETTRDGGRAVGMPFSFSVQRPTPPELNELLSCLLIPDPHTATVDVKVCRDTATVRGVHAEIVLHLQDSAGWPA